MRIDTKDMKWTRAPKQYAITEDKIEMVTEPRTDLWQRTYYHFRNDNAPVLQMETDEKYFSFVVKTAFDTKVRYDQSGIVMYEGFGIAERARVDSLKNVAGSVRLGAHIQAVGDIDIACGQLLDRHGRAAQLEVGGDFQNGIVMQHDFLLVIKIGERRGVTACRSAFQGDVLSAADLR